MTWLITGGAGYIGAHVVRAMTEAGEQAVVYDDLSTGIAARVPDGVPLVVGSTLDAERVARTLADQDVTGVVHLAGKKQVGESVDLPLHYYRENVEGLRVLLEAVTTAGVPSFVFSSSAAVYGMPDVELVTEETPCVPMSPYGETKLAGEWLVRATGRATGLSTASLRYFNVAGAGAPNSPTSVSSTSSPWSSRSSPRTRPRASSATTTPPRTAPVSATTSTSWTWPRPMSPRPAPSRPPRPRPHPQHRPRGRRFGPRDDRPHQRGHRLRPPPTVHPRRPGDPARVVASADRITTELGWKAKHDVQDMIASAWEGWVRLHPGAARS